MTDIDLQRWLQGNYLERLQIKIWKYNLKCMKFIWSIWMKLPVQTQHLKKFYRRQSNIVREKLNKKCDINNMHHSAAIQSLKLRFIHIWVKILHSVGYIIKLSILSMSCWTRWAIIMTMSVNITLVSLVYQKSKT